jgi:hypothetical protein
VLFETQNAQAPSTPSKTEVVFKRYGDGYVLKDIWIEGSDEGAETMPVEAEHHVTKQHAAAGEQRVAGRKKAAKSNGH